MRVLYLSYFYPPLGGPAALRNLKTVKYLAQSGIVCDVITVRDIEYLYRDPALMEENAAATLIRTDSLDPMALLKKGREAGGGDLSRIYLNTPEKLKLRVRQLYPVDNKIGWLPALIKAGRRAIRERRPELIFVSLGPFSSGIGAYALSRESGIPLAVDLRDYWTLLGDYDLQGGALNRSLSRGLEQRIYSHASLIITATAGIGTDAAQAFGADLAEKMLTVYNGWDEADFSGLPAPETPAGFTFAYFGNIYARRSLRHFYAALKRLRAENTLPPGTRVKLYGNFFRETLREVEHSGIQDLIDIVPQLSHRQALAAMQASSALLLVINSSSPRGTLTSKLFEYLRAQKPILAMVPGQYEAAKLLGACGHDLICAMESSDSIYHCLKRLFAQPAREYSIPWELERKNQVAKLAEKLKSLF